MITMFIAPCLGDMVGDELNNKNFDFGEFRHANDTRLPAIVTRCRHALRGAKTTPLSLKGWRFGNPCTPTRHANDTFDTRHFWGAKIKLKSIASVASDNKDEMYIPDDPQQVEKHLRNKGAPLRHPLACAGRMVPGQVGSEGGSH